MRLRVVQVAKQGLESRKCRFQTGERNVLKKEKELSNQKHLERFRFSPVE